MISPRCTHDIPPTYSTPPDVLNIPRCTEHTLYWVDLKATWKILKEVTNKGNKSTDINEVLFEGEKVTDVKIIPEAFNHHFASIGGKLASEIPEPKMQSCDYLSKTGKSRFKKIHPKSVFAILSKLKNGKASGMSMIPNKILKSAKHNI